MRITTWNVNGLRAALRKGLPDHLERIAPDALMLQEIRALPEQLPQEWVEPPGWHVHWHPAERKGYAGVATWTRAPSELVGTGIGGEDPVAGREPSGHARFPASDPEGRVLLTEVLGVRLVNVYLPSGSSGPRPRPARRPGWSASCPGPQPRPRWTGR